MAVKADRLHAALSDERFDRLAATFNQMLDTLEQDSHQLHELSQAILQAQEDERQRVARELHDEAAQALTSLLVRLRSLERAGDPEAAREHLQELRALTAHALEDVRRIALELRPTILDDLGLTTALGWRVDEFNAAGAARATLQVVGVDGRLPRPIELTCYRVVQEGLTNAARHAAATRVQICLHQEDNWLALRIFDDGQGFDAMAVQADRAQGLGLLRPATCVCRAGITCHGCPISDLLPPVRVFPSKLSVFPRYPNRATRKQ